MRIVVGFVLSCAATRVAAQGLVGGIALDSASQTPLPCVDVTLEDSTGRVLGRTRTARDGAFQFALSAPAVYRFEFRIWNHPAVAGPLALLDPSRNGVQPYLLTFGDPQESSGRPPPDTAADAPPWPRGDVRAPRYPTDLREGRISGGVVMRFVIDSAGLVDQTSVQLIWSTAPGFANAVRDHLREARFTPGRRGHRPVCSLHVTPFLFRVQPVGMPRQPAG